MSRILALRVCCCCNSAADAAVVVFTAAAADDVRVADWWLDRPTHESLMSYWMQDRVCRQSLKPMLTRIASQVHMADAASFVRIIVDLLI